MRERYVTTGKIMRLLLITVLLLLSAIIQVSAFSGEYKGQTITCTKISEPLDNPGVACQGGSNYGKFYLQTITGTTTGTDGQIVQHNTFYLYDIDANKHVATIPYDGSDGGFYKNNNANFGTEFYQDGDILPLIYISSAYDYKINVFRIYNESGLWKAMRVQTISYGTTMSNSQGFYSCNVVLDNEHGYLYLTPLSKQFGNLDNVQSFYKFNMPPLSAGNVELTVNDAVDSFSVADYIHAPQGAIIRGDYLYQLHGVTNAFLRVFDLQKKDYIKTYRLCDFGYNKEPESLGYYNGAFYSMDSTMQVWKITIENAAPSEEDIGTSKRLQLTSWELGSVNPNNGKETVSEKIARMDSRVLTLGADKLIVEPPAFYSGKVHDGYYYKWRVIWFNGNDCLGLADEQCDFTTFTEFIVPMNADSFRLAIAAVKGGKTEQRFPLSEFITKKGMAVRLIYSVNNLECASSMIKNVDNWELGSFFQTGEENNKTRIARTTELVPAYGATTLTVDIPVHYSGATTPTTYYKWVVQWYQGITCIGQASEQTDFDTITHYTVPINADGFRIKIASVVNGTTEDPFPLDTFLDRGTMKVVLSGVHKTNFCLDDWEIGSFDPTTGIENTKTRIARTTKCISTSDADVLYVEPLVHYSGETSIATYYKWRIVWFKGSTCLGIATEQRDFSTNTTFAVPTNADSFRMTVASVVNTLTEDPFPLSIFTENDYISISLLYTD